MNTYTCHASAVAPNEISLSIDAKSLSLKKVCEIIFNETGYHIVFDEKLREMPISLKLEKGSLSEAIRRIIRLAGIENYALVQNAKEIKIYSFGSSSLSKTVQTNNMVEELLEKSSGEKIGLGLTLAEMKSLKEENEKKQKAIPEDTVMTPPTESGRGLTLRELKALKQEQAKNRKNLPGNTIVTPPSESGKGMTIDELEALKKKQKIKMDNTPKDAIVTPPSDSTGRGLTRGEIEAIKKAHEEEMAKKFKNYPRK